MNKKANPQDVKNELVTIRLKMSTKEKLQALANSNGLSQGNTIRELINKAKPTLTLTKDL